MSLYVNGRAVTREQLEKNFKTLNDPLRNYAPVRQMYVPPSTVGYSSITANEAVYKAGLAQAKIQSMEKKRTYLKKYLFMIYHLEKETKK